MFGLSRALCIVRARRRRAPLVATGELPRCASPRRMDGFYLCGTESEFPQTFGTSLAFRLHFELLTLSSSTPYPMPPLLITDLGLISWSDAYALQQRIV